MNKITKKIFIILFAILYICVCGVSMLHAIKFFGLANDGLLSVILAVTFEIGQAAVLFSILTGNGGKRTFIPWVLMIILTTVQIIGNVFSSYEYLILNSSDNLRFFKEPIFIWTTLPDDQCNVILSYLMGGILPVVALLLTSMVTNYIGVDDKKESEEINLGVNHTGDNGDYIIPSKDDSEETIIPSISESFNNIVNKFKKSEPKEEEPKEEEPKEEEPKEEEPKEEEPKEEPNQRKSHFINL